MEILYIFHDLLVCLRHSFSASKISSAATEIGNVPRPRVTHLSTIGHAYWLMLRGKYSLKSAYAKLDHFAAKNAL
jgi:hypothetical protein